jgi:hypothetical protein
MWAACTFPRAKLDKKSPLKKKKDVGFLSIGPKND